MKIGVNPRKLRPAGYALLFVLSLVGVSVIIVGSALSWTSSSASNTERNNRYFNTLAAAEAATEKVITSLSRDYQNSGEGTVFSSLSSYRLLVPTIAESGYWANYAFNDAQGNSSQTYTDRLTSWGYTNLQSQYVGLRGMAATYRVVSNARDKNVAGALIAGLKQDIQVASIPIFQFAIFYSVDLEINPGANMNVTGRVHSNADLFTQPDGSTLTFLDHVTAVGKIYPNKKPGDPGSRSPGTIMYVGEHDAGVTSLNLPVGTNNSPAAVQAILSVPPVGESPTSLMGKQRYYNKADLVLRVSDTNIVATSGLYNGFATSVPFAEVSAFATTNVNFYNKREGKTVKATQIDVSKLRQWSATNTTIRSSLGRDVSLVYVSDERSQTGSTESGVRVINGQLLPPLGLTVATPNPLYVKGHYNAPAAALGTTNTSGTLPASLVADAITVLSTAWDDANAGAILDSRVAADTTVNAAFLSGIVPTTSGSYSGGVENFPRFLEKWTGNTFTYNGSMVVMFFSQFATTPWGGSAVYAPPVRKWAFDVNFLDATKLPPGTPQVLTVIRGVWAIVPPNTTT